MAKVLNTSPPTYLETVVLELTGEEAAAVRVLTGAMAGGITTPVFNELNKIRHQLHPVVLEGNYTPGARVVRA